MNIKEFMLDAQWLRSDTDIVCDKCGAIIKFNDLMYVINDEYYCKSCGQVLAAMR